MTSKNSISILILLALAIGVTSCGGKKFTKSPVDEMVRGLPTEKPFSIILHDMDTEGSFFSTYKHQYQIIQEDASGEVKETLTEWTEVGEREFKAHIDNMGMEIVARDSTGKLTKEVAPPGYNNYVGNSQYGYWQSGGGGNFWAFYGQYAFMSSMFRMGTYPAHRSYYNDWNGNYRGTGRGYYGPTGGSRYYGTGSAHSMSNSTSRWNSKSSSFGNNVRSRTSRSSSRSGSTSRSRSGGFGK